MRIGVGIDTHAVAAGLPQGTACRAAGIEIGGAGARSRAANLRCHTRIVAGAAVAVGAEPCTFPVLDRDIAVTDGDIFRAFTAARFARTASVAALATLRHRIDGGADALTAALVGGTCIKACAAIELRAKIPADSVAAA